MPFISAYHQSLHSHFCSHLCCEQSMGVERRTVFVWKTASEMHTAQSDQCFPLGVPLREKSKKI